MRVVLRKRKGLWVVNKSMELHWSGRQEEQKQDKNSLVLFFKNNHDANTFFYNVYPELT